MYAIITGASSGIGYEIAKALSKEYDLILVARSNDKLLEIKSELKCNVIVETLDLSILDNCHLLYEKYMDYEIDVFVNNAGFGKIGYDSDINLETQENMINLNVMAVYSLTHLFSKVVKSHILNVASLASFMPGPKMANYYATKAYVLSLSRALNYEQKRKKNKLRISTLCPGPVRTNFNARAKGEFIIKGLKADKVAKRAIKKMKKGKAVIYPSFGNRFLAIMSKIIPHGLLHRMTFSIQDSK